MRTIKIIIATHKKTDLPDDPLYLPVFVGSALRKPEELASASGYQRDDEGPEQISDRNLTFSELTGIYWAWKNLKDDFIGVSHYRRFFCLKKKHKKIDSILKLSQIEPLLDKYDIFVPKKRRYYIETIYSHYSHTFDGTQLDKCRKIIEDSCPEYLDAFDKVMKRRWGYMFNMFIMKRSDLNEYCSWLFPVLFELENEIDTTNLSAFEKRLFGRVSEILFDVWLERQYQVNKLSKKRTKELKVIYFGHVNYLAKIKGFIFAKLFHRKYTKSF